MEEHQEESRDLLSHAPAYLVAWCLEHSSRKWKCSFKFPQVKEVTEAEILSSWVNTLTTELFSIKEMLPLIAFCADPVS